MAVRVKERELTPDDVRKFIRELDKNSELPIQLDAIDVNRHPDWMGNDSYYVIVPVTIDLRSHLDVAQRLIDMGSSVGINIQEEFGVFTYFRFH